MWKHKPGQQGVSAHVQLVLGGSGQKKKKKKNIFFVHYPLLVLFSVDFTPIFLCHSRCDLKIFPQNFGKISPQNFGKIFPQNFGKIFPKISLRRSLTSLWWKKYLKKERGNVPRKIFIIHFCPSLVFSLHWSVFCNSFFSLTITRSTPIGFVPLSSRHQTKLTFVRCHETWSDKTYWCASRDCNSSPQCHSWELSTVHEEDFNLRVVLSVLKISDPHIISLTYRAHSYVVRHLWKVKYCS